MLFLSSSKDFSVGVGGTGCELEDGTGALELDDGTGELELVGAGALELVGAGVLELDGASLVVLVGSKLLLEGFLLLGVHAERVINAQSTNGKACLIAFLFI